MTTVRWVSQADERAGRERAAEQLAAEQAERRAARQRRRARGCARARSCGGPGARHARRRRRGRRPPGRPRGTPRWSRRGSGARSRGTAGATRSHTTGMPASGRDGAGSRRGVVHRDGGAEGAGGRAHHGVDDDGPATVAREPGPAGSPTSAVSLRTSEGRAAALPRRPGPRPCRPREARSRDFHHRCTPCTCCSPGRHPPSVGSRTAPPARSLTLRSVSAQVGQRVGREVDRSPPQRRTTGRTSPLHQTVEARAARSADPSTTDRASRLRRGSGTSAGRPRARR